MLPQELHDREFRKQATYNVNTRWPVNVRDHSTDLTPLTMANCVPATKRATVFGCWGKRLLHCTRLGKHRQIYELMGGTLSGGWWLGNCQPRERRVGTYAIGEWHNIYSIVTGHPLPPGQTSEKTKLGRALLWHGMFSDYRNLCSKIATE